ncbi:MAG: ATP-grasp domain-containing protein [Planctomycetota bacterium]|nr:ATP-grasp domain-containing protein [Planctomycetota bacterium]
MSERLLIIGGSVRAAAMSARRAGFEPIAIDRFVDADLRGVCREFQRFDQLRQLPEMARRMSAADWIYTGPLENHPKLIEQLSKCRVLLGNDRTTLQQLRDPWCLAAVLGRAGLRSPELSGAGQIPVGDDWLRKPLRAAGGFGIERSALVEQDNQDRVDAAYSPRRVYFQKFVPGRSIGATFLGARGRAVLVGVTEQLLGPTWGGSREFQYVGSVGPIELSPEHARSLMQIGDCVVASFPVQGLFGVDAIINADGVWPVEVNPRYTASIEILERALNVATLNWHVAACRTGELPQLVPENLQSGTVERHGKAVVYASREVTIDVRLERELCAGNGVGADSTVADLPVAGTSINAGEPIVTVFAKGKTSCDVKQGLRTAIADVTRLAGDV